MAELLIQCKTVFGTKDLYGIFDVPKDATQDKLKKAYYKLSLKVHPDKNPSLGQANANATEKFQLLSKLYQILSDEKKRKIYDKTGEIDDDDSFGLTDDKDWQDYWRELFPAITVDQIKQFHSEYKGSEEELSDLKKAYTSCKGNMQNILDSVMCASIDDEQRFRDLLKPFIDSNEVPTYKKFASESAKSKKKRHSKAAEEAKEAVQAAKELKGDSLEGYSDLVLAMQRNKEKRGGIISYLEQKYAAIDNDSSDDEDLVIKPKKKPSKGAKRKPSSSSKPSSSQGKRQRKA